MTEPAECKLASYSDTEFLEGVAHELRGPAGVTLGALDEIELALGADAERLKPLLSIARRGARRLLRTADRLQLTGQLEAKRIRWDLERTELCALVEQATRDAEELESRRGVRVTSTGAERPCMASVDPTWLRTVIMELVGQSIRRARTSVSVATTAEASKVRITISDDGVDRPRPVISGNASRERQKLGLSLALARDIAAAHGGSLFVEPRESGDPREHGLSLKLELPLSDSD